MKQCKNYNLQECFFCRQAYPNSCILDDLLKVKIVSILSFLENKEILAKSIDLQREYIPHLRKAIEIRCPENLDYLDKILLLI